MTHIPVDVVKQLLHIASTNKYAESPKRNTYDFETNFFRFRIMVTRFESNEWIIGLSKTLIATHESMSFTNDELKLIIQSFEKEIDGQFYPFYPDLRMDKRLTYFKSQK